MIPKYFSKQKDFEGETVLDDLKFIHQRDKSDALGIASKQAEQYLYEYKFSWQPPKEIHEIVVAGMGGSGLAAKAYSQINDLSVPFSVIQGYDLPDRVTENTLIICSSYSGNTEETLSVLNQALNKKVAGTRPMIVAIGSGGNLLEIANKNNLPAIKLPSGLQPRFTFGYQYRALVELLASTPLVDGEIEVLETSAKKLPAELSTWLPDVPTKQNLAKQIALDLVGKSPVIYAGKMFPAAYKWKISLNENAKNVAWCNQFPEFNHNEFIGWSSHPVEKPYAPIFLQSNYDHSQVVKRFNVSEKLLSGKMPSPIKINAVGNSLIGQLLWTVALGDFVSLYLALLNNIDPTPVDLIEKLKKELA